MIKAIIFDCFGVLTGSSFKEIFRQAGGNLAVDEPFVDEQLTLTNSGRLPTAELHQRIADHLGLSVEEWIQFVSAREQPNKDLFAYAASLKPNYKLAILSNANRGVLPQKIPADQLALFDAVIASADVGYMKPDPEIYKLTAEKLGVEPSECVFIDDGRIYVEAAEAVGMKAIHYQNVDQLKQELTAILA